MVQKSRASPSQDQRGERLLLQARDLQQQQLAGAHRSCSATKVFSFDDQEQGGPVWRRTTNSTKAYINHMRGRAIMLSLVRVGSELAFKSLAVFAVAVWPRCSDASKVVRSTIQFASDAQELVFRCLGTKELKLPILSAGIGISAGWVVKVCPSRTLWAYLGRSKDWDHGDRVWCCTRKQGGKYLPVTEKECSFRRWMRNIMTRVGIDPNWTERSST